MSKPWFRKTVLSLIGLSCIVLYTATRGNVRWRLLRQFPHAQIDLRSESRVEPSLDGMLCRGLGLRYFSPFEPVGIRISDHPTAVDFTHFKGMMVTFLTLERCIITDVRPLLTQYRPETFFIDCDMSNLPDDQKRFIAYLPMHNIYRTVVPWDEIPRYPGGSGNENFYP